MYDQVMGTFNPVIAFYKPLDLLVYLRGNSLSNERFQRIFRDTDTRPHDDKSYTRADKAVDVDARRPEKEDRYNSRTCSDSISHRIRKHRHHHFRVDLRSQLPVKKTEPKLHRYGQHKDEHRYCLKI